MTIRGKAFSGTPEDAALVNPWTSPSPLIRQGTPIGTELGTGRVVYFDPWLMQVLRIITGTIFLIIGERDSGKSSLLNMLIMRMMTRQAGVRDGIPQEMRVRITTRKPNEGVEVEFKPVNDYLYGNFVDMNRAGLINIFDHKMGMSEWDLLETAVNVCELANNNVLLRDFQPLALQVGVHKMLTQFADIAAPEVLEIATRSLDMNDVDHYFQKSNSRVLTTFDSILTSRPELKKQLQLTMDKPVNVPEQQFRQDAAFVSQQIGRVLRGDFGQVFGGTNSMYDIFTDTVSTLNMTGLNSKARTLIESMLWKWNTTGPAGGRPGLNIGDEEHEGANSLMYMRFWAADVAKARAFTTLDLRATQFIKQLTEAGAEGSEIRSLARQIAMGVGGHFIGRQPNDENALDDVRALGLAEHDVYFTTQLKVGQFGFKVPNRPVIFFQTILTPTELDLSETNQASKGMMETIPVMSLAEIEERSRQAGWLQAGL